ncbi:hypothetical protein ACFRJ9_09450 [Paenarthrobacter sp. NPDC056912]|uniref:hypothetical protein n=1 Tax=Paenarthrobacter sp. NPDC056912 TaxID=3345965 RepID=UPI00366D3108
MSTPLLRPHTKWPVALGFGIVGSLIVAIVVLAFLWPAKTTAAHNLPISISGPTAAVTALKDAIATQQPDAFDFVEVANRDAAVSQIKARETYGGIVLGDATTMPEVLTAPAGSAAATQILNGVAAQLQVQLTQRVAAAGGNPATAKVTVTPVVPLSASDPNGSGLAAASFPMAMGGMIGGALISLLVVGAIRRLVALAGFGVAVGLILALILDTWFGFLQGDFWINASAIALSILATSAFIVGCTSLLGTKGIAIGAVLTLFVGNPISSAAAPWQFLPEPWGAVGQFFVPGAASWLIRSLSYFPDANVAPQWWILLGWTAVGLILTLVGHFRAEAAMTVPAGTLEDPEREAANAHPA